MAGIMKSNIIIGLFFLGRFVFAQADDNAVFVVYGANHMIGVSLPVNTWTVNMRAAKQMGVNAIFHPGNYSLNNTPVGLFMILNDKENNTFESFADHDSTAYANDMPNSEREELNWDIEREDGQRVIVYKIYNASGIMYTAYVDTGEGMDFYVNFFMQIRNSERVDINSVELDYMNCLKKTNISGIGLRFSE
jgi:hypothetical protein